MGFRTPNFQQFQQPQQQKQFQDQDQDLQPVGKRQKGTGFTNIGKILGANVGAGERMGRQVGQAVGMQAGQARAGVTQAQEKFETAKKEAEQKADLAQQGIKKVLDDTSGLAGLTEEQAKERRERFLKEGQYTGPKGLEQEAQLKARAEALGDVATMGMSGRGGRQQLARSIVAGPGMYTRGQSLLDATLLGQSGAAQRAIEEGSRQALGAQQQIGKTALSAQQQAKIAESALSKEKEAIGKKVGEKIKETEKAGEEASKSFYKEAQDLQALLSGKAKLVTEQEAAEDPEKAELRKKQIDILKNTSKFGIETGIKVGSGQMGETDADILLGNIASSLAMSSGPLYTNEQKAALANLSLFAGDEEKAKAVRATEFKKTPFEGYTSKEEMLEEEKALEQQRQTNLSNIQNEIFRQLKQDLNLPRDTNERIQTQQDLINYINAGGAMGERGRPQTPYSSVVDYAKYLSNYYSRPDLSPMERYGARNFNLGAYGTLVPKYESESQTQLLQDYINKKFGIQ